MNKSASMIIVLGTCAVTSGVAAQNTANVSVTVIPAYQPGQPVPARDGFNVCVGTAADRDLYGSQLTPLNGVANTAFRNLPAGQQALVTISKSGRIGIERTITLAPSWNNVQVNPQPGIGGPVCPQGTVGTVPPAPAPVVPPSPTPTPTPTPVPPPPVGSKSLNVIVLNSVSGLPVQGAQVCVGVHRWTTELAGIQRTSSTGRAYFTVPALYSVMVTASHAGFVGVSNEVLLPTLRNPVSTTISLVPGALGRTCPGAVVDPVEPPPPVSVSSTFQLNVSVMRSSGTRLPDATLCVGSSATAPASYETQQTNGSIGNRFTLPRAATYRITASRPGYGATAMTYTPPANMSSANVTLVLPANSATSPRCSP